MEEKAFSETSIEKHLRGGAPTGDDSSEVEEKSKDWLKIIILFLVSIFLLSGAFYAGYWFGKSEKLKMQSAKPQLKTQSLTPTPKHPIPTSTPDPTADWKTYTSRKLGFEIKYPIDWYVHKEASITPYLLIDSPGYSGLTISSPILQQVDSGTRIFINRLENSKDISLDQLTSDYIIKKDKEKVMIDGKEGIRIDAVIEFGIYETVVFNIKDNFIYQINRIYPQSQKSQYEEIFTQVLSTFKFLD